MRVRANILLAACLAASCASSPPPPASSTRENAPPATNRPAPNASTSAPPAPVSVPGAPTPVSNGTKVDAADTVDFGSLASKPEGWQWIDPERRTPFEIRNERLSFVIPPGADMAGETRLAPRFVKAVEGDFDLETRLEFAPAEDGQGAGLFVFRNDSNYLRFEKCQRDETRGLCFDSREDETTEPLASPADLPVTARLVELRLTRRGREFASFWREPGREWRPVARVSTSYPPNLLVGIIGATSSGAVPVQFEYVRLLPAPK